MFRRVKVSRVKQPALHRLAIAGPLDTFGFTPRRLERVVHVRALRPRSDPAGPDFGWLRPRRTDQCRHLAIIRKRNARNIAAGPDRFLGRPECCRFSRRRIERADGDAAADIFAENNFPRRVPRNPRRRACTIRREILRSTRRRIGVGRTLGGHAIDVAARRSLIAHETLDEGDAPSVR